jgi:hypothetical protein
LGSLLVNDPGWILRLLGFRWGLVIELELLLVQPVKNQNLESALELVRMQLEFSDIALRQPIQSGRQVVQFELDAR